jgi:serine/threonine-protein kinase
LGPLFRAYEPERDRLVAVKLFTLDLPPERVHELVAEFERLIDTALAHDAIAAPLATGISGGSVYLAHEYVAAESLDVAIRAYGPAPVGDALRVAAQLAGALDFAAVVNVHHGALHPRDALLSPEETRLTGIGVARALERVGIAAPVRRPYSAPERIAGGPWDRRADIFSLAALVHELVWGRRITGAGAAAANSLTEIADGSLPALRSVFARALSEDPDARFATALEFAEALKNAFPNVAVVAPPPKGRPAREQREPLLPLDGSQPAEVARDVSPAIVAADVAQPPSQGFGEPRRSSPGQLASGGGSSKPAPQTDLDLRAAEEARYADVEVAPAIVVDNLATTVDTEDTEAKSLSGKDRSSVSSVVERSSASVPAGLLGAGNAEPRPSRTWPLALMLIFGVVAGLTIGYLAWSRPDAVNRVAPPPAVAANEPAPAPPPGREFTESTVPAAAKETGPAPSPKPAESAIRNPQPAMRNVESGRLLVRSTPAGATVFVDGREYGQTPVAIRDLARGAHRLRLVRDGYAPAERRVVITEARPSQSLVVPLAAPRATASRGTQSTMPAPATPATMGRYAGDLVIESKPSGARVYIDNKLAGTTPLSLRHVGAGSHVVRLERDGYRRWSSSVRVVAAERNRVTASLER